MRTVTTLAFLVVLALAAAFAAFLAYGRERTWMRLAGDPDLGRYDFAAASRSRTDNDALACTPGLCGGTPDFALAASTTPPNELVEAIARHIAWSHPDAERVDDRSDPRHLRYVTRSPFMRFPDTTVIEAAELPDGQTGLRAWAKAQLGRKDFGANRKRLETWLADYKAR